MAKLVKKIDIHVHSCLKKAMPRLHLPQLGDYTTPDELRVKYDEWGIEFLCEGRRRTDLIRWNMFVTEDWWDHQASNDKSKHRFPVPTKAISGNNNLAKDPM